MSDLQEAALKVLGASAFGAIVLFLVLIVAPVVGGIGGWIFAWWFEDSFAALQSVLHTQASGFEIGAVLGFLGSFFKSSSSSSNK